MEKRAFEGCAQVPRGPKVRRRQFYSTRRLRAAVPRRERKVELGAPRPRLPMIERFAARQLCRALDRAVERWHLLDNRRAAQPEQFVLKGDIDVL